MTTTTKAGAAILAVYTAAMLGIGAARATAEPRFDRFVSHRSGNVVRIPNRCWAEDSLAHLYLGRITDHGATVTLHCHHRGY